MQQCFEKTLSPRRYCSVSFHFVQIVMTLWFERHAVTSETSRIVEKFLTMMMSILIKLEMVWHDNGDNFYELESYILDETREKFMLIKTFIAWYLEITSHGPFKLKRKLKMILMYLLFAYYLKIYLFGCSVSKQEIKKMKSSNNENKNKNKNNVKTQSHVLNIVANMSVELTQSVQLIEDAY